MGNSESSSRSPSREHGGNQDSNRGRRRNEDGEEASSSSVGTALKVGAAVAAGAAAVALGAWSLASTSASNDSDDDGHGSNEKYQFEAGGVGGRGDRLLFEDYGGPRYPKPNSYHPDNTIPTALVEGGGGRGASALVEGYRRDPRPNSYYLGGINQNHVPRQIKIMTYNVFSRNDVVVDERMKAIGNLILQHDPDVILFQEVTPPICDIFQSYDWWEKYSASPEKPKGNHVCMLLSKLPVQEGPYKNSMPGRDLHPALIEVGTGKRLLVATAHFKSPNPPNEMYSKERKAQAENALSFLDCFPNVVFGGDMNWDEDSDGPFPLLHGWVDAWAQLKRGENGWTYDTKSNPMLKGHKPLQKRLDRFICKPKDFELISVDIIGTEPIADLPCTYIKKVPALPSDHYGLLLTISF